ncbi:hypothetical protein MPNT_40111 [Candidatus Methylacidithermus pantelleriae]|uniref:Uncharacterized protein n=1 Tax=Candidatus Methylacidithermus pantelleriae TaxID=2744239 RepID=A0A8J2FPA4_9BACT|nr:hypothetical protein MPNT_40111 [Candidatus Methylacidithermus pantelleriae]
MSKLMEAPMIQSFTKPGWARQAIVFALFVGAGLLGSSLSAYGEEAHEKMPGMSEQAQPTPSSGHKTKKGAKGACSHCSSKHHRSHASQKACRCPKE